MALFTIKTALFTISRTWKQPRCPSTDEWIKKLWYIYTIYLQGDNEETDIENRLMDMGRGEERVRCLERVTWKLTLPYVNR